MRCTNRSGCDDFAALLRDGDDDGVEAEARALLTAGEAPGAKMSGIVPRADEPLAVDEAATALFGWRAELALRAPRANSSRVVSFRAVGCCCRCGCGVEVRF